MGTRVFADQTGIKASEMNCGAIGCQQRILRKCEGSQLPTTSRHIIASGSLKVLGGSSGFRAALIGTIANDAADFLGIYFPFLAGDGPGLAPSVCGDGPKLQLLLARTVRGHPCPPRAPRRRKTPSVFLYKARLIRLAYQLVIFSTRLLAFSSPTGRTRWKIPPQKDGTPTGPSKPGAVWD
jgi:hypothetical protein